MNNPTTDKKIIVSIIVIIFVAISFLFLKGEISLHKASRGYDIVAFQNTAQKINSPEVLNFYIQNLGKNEGRYEIFFSVNGKSISQITENIKSGKRKKIQPTADVISQVKNNNSESFKYKVEIKKDNEKKIIYKQIIK